MVENTQNTTATTNEGEGKKEASGVKVPTVESAKEDSPEALKVQKEETITEAVTGSDVEGVVKDLLKRHERPEHIEDAFACNPMAEQLYETSDTSVFLQESDALNHTKFLQSKTVKTYKR